MKFLVAGLGSIGRRHLRNLRELGQEEILLLRSGKSTLPDEELLGLPVAHDIDQALRDWRPDAVIVSNPTALHLDVSVPSAMAGCHLLLEKPVSNDWEGIDDLRSAVATGGGKVLVGFQFRFHPGLRQAKDMIDAGTIGRPINARVHWGEYLPDWHPWEDYRRSYSARQDLGGGVVNTLSHPFDYLRWLFGNVQAVAAEVGQLGELEIEVEDTADVLLRFRQGLLANVHLDYNQRPAGHWLEVTGTEGTLRWEDEDGLTRWWSMHQAGWQATTIAEDFERNTLFLDEMAHFLEMIDGEVEPICSLDDGIRALEVTLAVHESSRIGRRVALPMHGMREGEDSLEQV